MLSKLERAKVLLEFEAKDQFLFGLVLSISYRCSQVLVSRQLSFLFFFQQMYYFFCFWTNYTNEMKHMHAQSHMLVLLRTTLWPSVLVSQRPSGLLSQCPGLQVFQCPSVLVSWYPRVLMFWFPSVPVSKDPSVQVSHEFWLDKHRHMDTQRCILRRCPPKNISKYQNMH